MSESTEMLKLLLIGDSGVGKSCLLARFTDNKFDTTFISTIGIDFKVRHVNVDGHPVKLELWDTAGQERFRSITNAYYRGAMGIIVVYDVTNAESFKSVRIWLDNVARLASDGVFKMLVANKIDLADRRVVSTEEGKALAAEADMPYFETSAKSGAGVEESFMKFVTTIARKRREKREKALNRNGLNLDRKPAQDSKCKC
eukprot:PhM_4_TR5578/c0_g1_i1/m.5860